MYNKKVDLKNVRPSIISKVLSGFWDAKPLEVFEEDASETKRFIYKRAELTNIYNNRLSPEEIRNILIESTEKDYMEDGVKYEESEFEIYHSIVFDIENELMIMDNIFYKYISNYIPANLTFIKNYRYPLLSQNFKGSNIEVSNRPFHPYLSVESIAEVLTMVYIDHSGAPVDYLDNKLIPTNNVVKFNKFRHFTRSLEIVEIVYKHLFFKVYESNFDLAKCREYVNNNLDKEDDLLINAVLNNIIIKFLELTKNFTQNTFNIEYSGRLFTINIGENIHSFRYKEAIAYNESNCIEIKSEGSDYLGEYEEIT